MSILFQNVTVVTMNEQREVLKNAFVAVTGNKITAVSTVKPEGTFERVIDGTGKVLMSGLINAHTHIPMTLLRGYGGGHDLQTWLNEYIFPAEDKLDADCVRIGTALGMAELIASGCTAVEDMYYFCDEIIQQTLSAGLNMNVCRGTTCFGELGNPVDYPSCVDLRHLVEKYHGRNNGQILVDVSIHGEYTSPEKLWAYLGQYAADNKLGMHVHVSETRKEHEECIAKRGKTPLYALDEYGVWECGRSVAAHCVWATDEDYELMVKKNISCAHNPVSNLKLGSGIARVPAMRRAGVNVALGTDGVSSNNSQDMFEEIKLACILHCGSTCDPTAVTAMQALEMATINGAKALGRKTGCIAEGYDADIILVDFDRPNLIPCHDVVENLVYSARGNDVYLTMAQGKVLYENGVFFTLDMDKIRYEVAHYALPHMFG